MDKLELKHITQYAQYGLKGEFIGKVDILTEIDFVHGIVSSLNNGNCLVKDFKPILHPLSDLTEHAAKVWGIYSLKHLLRLIEFQQIPMHIYIELLEGHYDVNGLIEKNLAVDFNTIKS